MKYYLFFLLLTFIACDNFAVLVAGTNTWQRYRHQSDIYHAYQILVNRGMNPQNIIVFDYGGIAEYPDNPFPGQVFNFPDGKDVYAGVIIDYWGNDVTPENFMAVLTGDASAVTKEDERTTGKVLTSTESDHVFVYFTGQGSDDLIAFPDKYLYADELNSTLQTMYEKKLYKELVFYLEANHGDSMFKGLLPDNINIYAVASTFSNAEYCYDEAKVNDTLIGTCLGTQFSCRFMEDIDAKSDDDLNNYSFQDQYEYLVRIATESEVHQNGDLNVAQNSIYSFVSGQTQKFFKNIFKVIGLLFPPIEMKNTEKKTSRINNKNYRLDWFRFRAEKNKDYESEKEYYEEITEEGRTIKIFEIFDRIFELPERNYEDKIDFDCYRSVVKSYKEKCGMLIDRDFKFMTHIANFCTQGIDPQKAHLAFEKICQ